jgi:hypothetical protein
MPFQGYLHDLSLLTGQWDCLLPLTDSQTKLTANSHTEPKNNEYQNLSESTMETMMLLNTDSMTAGEAETLSLPTPCLEFTTTSLLDKPPPLPSEQNCDGKILSNMESSTQHPQSILQITDSTLRTQERCPFSNPANLTGLEEAQGEQTDARRLSPAATSPTPSQYRPNLYMVGEDERRAFTLKCITHPKSIPLIISPVPPDYTDEALSLQSRGKSKVLTPTSKSTDTNSFHPGMEQTTESPLFTTPPATSLESENEITSLTPKNMSYFASTEPYEKLSLPSATPSKILAPPEPPKSAPSLLTTLPSRKQEDHIADLKKRSYNSASIPAKRRQTSVSAYVPTEAQEQSNVPDNAEGPIPEPDDMEPYDDDDDDDDDILPSTKPRKSSERKRRMNAIADNYIQEKALKTLKEGISNYQKLEDQSARYIVNQAESQKIISTPREYQTELFERAKEKNIIAVLDTGRQIQKLNRVRLTFQAPARP